MRKFLLTKFTSRVRTEFQREKNRKKLARVKPVCVANGKVGSDQKVSHVIVAISNQKGVFICLQFEKMNVVYLVNFVGQNVSKDSKLKKCFICSKWELQLKLTVKDHKIRGFKYLWQANSIPARSADLNFCEDFFKSN